MDYFFSLMLTVNLDSQKLPTVEFPSPIVPVETIAAPTSKEVPARLSDAEIYQRMRNLPNWTTDGQALFHTRTFQDFVEAIAFVNSLVDPAEALGHHPDITINYNQVSLQLTTHDAGGLTDLDFQLAHRISQL